MLRIPSEDGRAFTFRHVCQLDRVIADRAHGPREVEELLARHAGVREVAVVALADPHTGERACSCVVPADPADPPTLPRLGAHLADLGVSRRKHPEQVEVLTALPLTASGKVAKSELRARFDRSSSRDG